MNSISLRTEPALVQLRKKAEQYATGRRERLTSVHLLAAIAEDGSPAARLLHERRLTSDELLRAARSSSDDSEHSLASVIDDAREFASRMRSPDPSPLHVLVALLSLKKSAAYRVLDQFGVDVPRLRLAAMNLGLGQPPASVEAPPAAVGAKRSRAVSVPLMQRAIGPTRRGTRGRTSRLEDEAQAAGAKPTEAARADQGASPATAPASGATRESRNKAQQPQATSRTSATLVSPKLSAEQAAVTRPQKATRAGVRAAVRGDQPALDVQVAKADVDAGIKNYQLSKEQFPILCSLGQNLTEAALRGELSAIIGRELEVERVLDVLAKQGNNSPCLVGSAGVGKSSIVSALAQRVATSAAPGRESVRKLAIDDRIFVEISVSDLLAGTGIRGALAERFTELQKELTAAKGRVVLILEDIPALFAGDPSGELSTLVRKGLASGEFCCVGTATSEDYERTIEADAALERRFARIDVQEPDLEVALSILAQRTTRLEAHHKVAYKEDALRAAIAWSARYLAGRALPDKAIAIADLAGAKVHRRGGETVTKLNVAEVISEASEVPVERLMEADGDRLLNLESVLSNRVVGHAEALGRISQLIRRSAVGLTSERPLGTILLLGPSGVGKTETAKALAEVLFGSEHALTRFDLSEFSEAHSVARLIGAPPGYVGHDAGGQLTETVRRRPYQVILLDEIEKAHIDVLQALLPLLDEGRFTDARGRVFDFTNVLLVLTSNLGSAEASGSGEKVLGFGDRPSGAKSAQERTLSVAKKALPPEFWNRIDETLVFSALTRLELREVARRMLQSLADRVCDQRGVELQIDANVVDLLLDSGGFDAAHGARPMRRAVARLVEGPLAQKLLAGAFAEGARVALEVNAGQLTIQELLTDSN